MRMPLHKNSPTFPAAKVTLPLNTGGNIQRELDSFQMSNNTDTVMDVSELRFLVMPNPLMARVYALAPSSLWQQFDFGSILSARVATSKVTLTPDFVHLRSFAAPKQWNLNASIDLATDSTSVNQIPYYSTSFRWRFPSPMSVRPGDGLRVSINLDPSNLWPVDPTTHNPFYAVPASVLTGVDVWVAAVGKLRDAPLPDLLPYPMALEWAPVIQPVGAGVRAAPAFAATGQTQLRNQGRSDMRIDRLVASLYAKFKAANVNQPGNTYQPIDLLNSLTNVVDATLADSRGYAIVAERTPLASIVDPRSGNWRFGSVLPFDQQIVAQLYANPLVSAQFPQGSDETVQPTLFPRLALMGEQLVGVPR